MGFSLGSNTVNDVKLGSSQVSELYLGSAKFWPDAPAFDVFIGGIDYDQSDIEFKLIGETITAFNNTGGNTQFNTSTNYTILFTGFSSEGITSYTDGGKCTFIDDSAFLGCSSLTSVSFPNVNYLASNAFENCNTLTSINTTNVNFNQIGSYSILKIVI